MAISNQGDLPSKVVRVLNQGSSPMTMDFHPTQQTILLVGTDNGDAILWEVASSEKLVTLNFQVWDVGECSISLQEALRKDCSAYVKRVLWCPDGSLFGVAYSRNIVHIYSRPGGSDVRRHLEIEAHFGGVNDIAFSTPSRELCIVTCGDDKTIKVWDASTGVRKYTFEGHEAPVYSVCVASKHRVKFIFSTGFDGRIKVWLYDGVGSRVNYHAPGRWCTRMIYTTDGKRLFSCGTSKSGESVVVEWNESEGSVKRTYLGLQKSSGIVQFDITKNRFLAVGDDSSIKYWDMDKVNLWKCIDADGGLPACPHICFNKDGTLLAVSANENRIKILADIMGLSLLSKSEDSCESSIQKAVDKGADQGETKTDQRRSRRIKRKIGDASLRSMSRGTRQKARLAL